MHQNFMPFFSGIEKFKFTGRSFCITNSSCDWLLTGSRALYSWQGMEGSFSGWTEITWTTGNEDPWPWVMLIFKHHTAFVLHSVSLWHGIFAIPPVTWCTTVSMTMLWTTTTTTRQEASTTTKDQWVVWVVLSFVMWKHQSSRINKLLHTHVFSGLILAF